MTTLLAILCAATAAALALPGRARLAVTEAPLAGRPDDGLLIRLRWVWSMLAGVGATLFVNGVLAPLVGVAAAIGVWVTIARAESPVVRRERDAVKRDLACLVDLFGAALASGAASADAAGIVAAALPGPAADRLQGARARLGLGVDPLRVWGDLAEDSVLAPLGRTLARAHATGAPVATAIERLADDLRARSRAEVEDRARTVGVKAAVPLGLCLLPAFLLLGIVPLAAGLLTSLAP